MEPAPERPDESENENEIVIDPAPTLLGRLAVYAERGRLLRERVEEARSRYGSVDVTLSTIERDSTIGGGMIGGALAYRFFVFLLPLALMLVAVAGIVADAGDESTSEIVAKSGITGYMASQIAAAASSSARWAILLLTFPALVYVTWTLYRSIAIAHAIACHRSGRVLRLSARGLGAFVAVLVALFGSIVVVGELRDSGTLTLLGPVAVYGLVLTPAWLLFARQLPSADRSWRRLLPGSLLIGFGMLCINTFNVYITAWLVDERADTYGALGVAAALLFCLYLIGRLIVASAELNATLSERRDGGGGGRAGRRLPPSLLAAVANGDAPEAPSFVSTGRLPAAEHIRTLLGETHERYRVVDAGRVSAVYPALAAVDPGLFGIAVVSTSGQMEAVGDAEVGFTVMSVSKPFVFALACEVLGGEEMRERLGVNATGLPFNSLAAVEQGGGRTNPMVNPGAIAATSLVPGADEDARWQAIQDGLSAFAGRELRLADDVYASALATNGRTHSIARLLSSYGTIYADPESTAVLYTRQCCLEVSARDLAVMGATLADGGVNPLTGVRVVSPDTCRHTLSVMATAGLYESSGEWLYHVGLPGKSGIGGGILTVAPGKGGLATFSPRLDEVGNSVRGELATRELSVRLGLDLFASLPEVEPPDS